MMIPLNCTKRKLMTGSVVILYSHISLLFGKFAFIKRGQGFCHVEMIKLKIWQEYPPGNPEGVVTVGLDSAWKCVCTLSGYFNRTVYNVDWCHTSGLIATAGGDDAICVFKEEECSYKNQPSFSLVTTVAKAHSQDVNCDMES